MRYPFNIKNARVRVIGSHFIFFTVAARVAERTHHKIVGQDVEVQLVPQPVVTTSEQLYPSLNVIDTVLVKGLSSTHNESVLKLYFTNKKKSGGGDVKSIAMKEEVAYVSFVDQNGNVQSVGICEPVVFILHKLFIVFFLKHVNKAPVNRSVSIMLIFGASLFCPQPADGYLV